MAKVLAGASLGLAILFVVPAPAVSLSLAGAVPLVSAIRSPA